MLKYNQEIKVRFLQKDYEKWDFQCMNDNLSKKGVFMKILPSILASTLSVFALSPAHAATINSSGNSGVVAGVDSLATVTLDLFDGNLGTLTGAFFEYEMHAEAVYFLFPANAVSGNALANDDFVGLNVNSFGPGLTQFPGLQSRDGAAFSTTDIFNYSQFVEGSASGSISRNINGWTGVGTTDLTFMLQLIQLDALSSNIVSDFRDVLYNVSVNVTYTYEPSAIGSVPLPAGGVLLLSGLIGIAGLQRRKKRTK